MTMNKTKSTGFGEKKKKTLDGTKKKLFSKQLLLMIFTYLQKVWYC